MTIGEFLAQATRTLQQAGIESARLDTLILLEDALKLDRALLLAHPADEIDALTGVELHKKIMQRITHLPLAYIRGTAPFYGRDFAVNKNVLVPRPETEAMIELLKGLSLPASARIADIGTGSGCIGITAALELPQTVVRLYDIDPQALHIAAKNARALGATITLSQSDLLDTVQAADVLLANLPYVPDNYPINPAASHEPGLALFAGQDGLELYRRFWKQLSAHTAKPACVLTEALLSQHQDMRTLGRAAGYRLAKTEGLIQQFECG